jgi:hypothetical protein
MERGAAVAASSLKVSRIHLVMFGMQNRKGGARQTGTPGA